MKKIILLLFLLSSFFITSAQCWNYVSAGTFFTIAIKSNGTLWEWGRDDGIGNFTYTNIPAQVGTDNDWKIISAGSDHCVGIKTNGTLWAWGENFLTQLGDGTTISKNFPVQVGTDNNWQSISAGTSHTLALKTDGTLWSWGFNGSGELGLGNICCNNSYHFIPTQIGTGTWNFISAGTYNSFAIKTDGTLWAWGDDTYSQLGDRDNMNKNVPTQIGTDSNWKQVKGGISHTLAIKTDGTLWAWGDNTFGQIGDGTNIQRPVPVQIGTLNNWQFIGASIGQSPHYFTPNTNGSHSMAIKNDGTLWAWGRNDSGQLGDGTNLNRNIPTQIGSSNNWQLVSLGQYHTAALNTNATINTWGSNSAGQMGDSTKVSKNIPTEISCTRSSPATQCWQLISSGYSHSLSLKNDGTLWAWGVNQYAVFGNATVNFGVNIPTQTNTDTDWFTVSAGQTHTLALKSNGTLWAWGHNDSGQLGDGTYNTRYVPIQIGTSADWKLISAGQAHQHVYDYEHSLAIKNDGTLWAWGENNFGQLGDGSNNSKNTPEQIAVGTTWKMVSAGEDYSLAIKNDGTLWAWGRNDSGQLGDGTYNITNVPIQIGTNANWKYISAGWEFSLAVTTDGTLWAWGDNRQGKLGDGTYTNKNVPTKIGISTNWIAVSAGGQHSLGLQLDGTLWAWGSNQSGQLGDGTTNNETIPVKIGGATDWKYISAGLLNSSAIKTDGTLWVWGYDLDGELGDGLNLAGSVLPHEIKCEPTNLQVLPVLLQSFTAQKQHQTTLLNWQTATEQNNKEYQIERSSDGNKFKEIASIPSKNNISGGRYSYIDEHPLSGNNYYRLESIDIDGKFSYSNINRVTFNITGNHVIIYPNPAKDILIVQSNFKGEKLNITITDLAGRKILQTNKQNNQLIEIQIPDLRVGFYLLKINDGITSVSKKIIKE